MPKMQKNYKRNSKRWNFVEIWDFKYLNFLIKSQIYTIKQQKNFQIFLKTIDR